MALAIKATPALEGKDSKRFNLLLGTKKMVSKETIAEIRELTKKILSTKK